MQTRMFVPIDSVYFGSTAIEFVVFVIGAGNTKTDFSPIVPKIKNTPKR